MTDQRERFRSIACMLAPAVVSVVSIDDGIAEVAEPSAACFTGTDAARWPEASEFPRGHHPPRRIAAAVVVSSPSLLHSIIANNQIIVNSDDAIAHIQYCSCSAHFTIDSYVAPTKRVALCEQKMMKKKGKEPVHRIYYPF